ncbi:MAG: PilZ domain-containing protein [Mariprofundaceae bacterium]|nr:PilZ domain-containing protein [Mariprofundaceae bacterium]
MPQQTPQERREHPRQSVNFHIEVKIHANQTHTTVELRDISEGGMSFIVDSLEDYHEDQRLQVSVPEYDEKGLLQHQHLQAEIAWLQEQDLLNPQAWVGLRLLAEV